MISKLKHAVRQGICSLERMVRRHSVQPTVKRISECETIDELNKCIADGKCKVLATPMSGNWSKRTVSVRYIIGHLQ